MMQTAQREMKQWLGAWWQQHSHGAQKTASYTVMHMVVAVMVAWVMTGSWRVAVAISMVEPLVQAVAYHLHEKAWLKKRRNHKGATRCAQAVAVS